MEDAIEFLNAIISGSRDSQCCSHDSIKQLINSAKRWEYLVNSRVWPKDVYDAMILNRQSQNEVVDRAIKETK